MKNRILVALIVAAAALTVFAILFAIFAISHEPTGLTISVAIVALITALTSLWVTIVSYRRVKRRSQP